MGLDFAAERERMVAQQIVRRGVRDREVLRAMATVPRHMLVPSDLAHLAYSDQPLPIGGRQTISQPYIVAAMVELARVRPGSRVLDIGTGSGYQAAVLAEIGADVFTIEIVPDLAARARADLERMGYRQIHFRVGDGSLGLADEAPFDAIIAAAAPPHIPRGLVEQLVDGGRLVIPVGRGVQDLVVIERTDDDVRSEVVFPVRFVPMVGRGTSDSA